MERATRKKGSTSSKHRSCFRFLAIAWYLLLATGLSLVTGCATSGKAKVDPVVPNSAAEKANLEPAAVTEQAPPKPAGPSVMHLSDGREGFVIKEQSGLDGEMRAEFEQGTAMIKDAKYGQAVEVLEKLIAKAPGLTAPRINVAIAYGQLQKPEQAEQHLKKALEVVPGHPLASNEYGLLLRKGGRFAESRKIYEDSIAVFPEYYPVHKNLGILCDLYLRDSTCAIEQYQIYASAVPKDLQVKVWLADLQSRGHQVASLKLPGE